MTTMHSNEKGFMAITSVVFVTATFVIIFISMFFYASEEATREVDRERVLQAHSYASSCAEIALQKLMTDFYYVGGTNYTVGEGSCYVLVQNYGLYGKNIMAEGSHMGEDWQIQVFVDAKDWPDIEIFDLQDVAEFYLQ